MADKSKNEKVLILRTCDKDMRSYGGFRWPESGFVEAPDWRDDKECGHGLHGFLRGEGDGELASFEVDAKWVCALVESASIVDLGGKVKFARAEVVFVGERTAATEYMRANGCTGAIVGGTATAGTRGTATAGYAGTATAGYAGTATAGTRGTATAGYAGTATAGYAGTATAGYAGTATAGYAGILNIRWYDLKMERYQITTFYVGEDGIEPNTAYRLDDKGKVVKA